MFECPSIRLQASDMPACGRHLTKATLKRSTYLFRGYIQQPRKESLATGKRCDYFMLMMNVALSCSNENILYFCHNKFSCIMKRLSEQSWRTGYHEIIKVSLTSLTQWACQYMGESSLCFWIIIEFFSVYVQKKPERVVESRQRGCVWFPVHLKWTVAFEKSFDAQVTLSELQSEAKLQPLLIAKDDERIHNYTNKQNI